MSLLNTYKNSATEKIESDVKDRSKAILRDYRNGWDIYSELLQNSVDSINRKYDVLQNSALNDYDYNFVVSPLEEEFKGKILLEICPSSKTIAVSDNGTGLQGNKIEKLLLPDGTDKKPGKEYGYKGKGLTYAVFASDKFKITSKFMGTPDETNTLELNGLFEWVTDSNNYIDFPSSPIPDVTKTKDDLGEYNTKIELKLHDNYKEDFSPLSNLDGAFSFINYDSCDTFVNLLRTKTAIGNTNVLFGKNPIVDIDVLLVVYNDDGLVAIEQKVPYSYDHPKDRVEKENSYDFEYYVNDKLPEAGADKKFYCLTNTKIDVPIGEKNPINVSVCISAILKESLNSINDDLNYDKAMIKSGAGYTPGVYLSIDGMPTGIRIGNWVEEKGANYLRYYVIVDCSLAISNELDSGRKGISQYRANQISDFAFSLKDAKIYNSDKFHAYAISELTSRVDDKGLSDLFCEEEEANDFSKRVKRAKSAKEEQEKDPVAQFVINNSSLIHVPDNEEEVRTLFHELLAKGIIKGYKTVFDAANRSVYDSALDYYIDVDEQNSNLKDPNGYSESVLSFLQTNKVKKIDFNTWKKRCKHSKEQVLCTEFKYGLNDLLYDLLKINSSKLSNEIDIVITWDYSIADELKKECQYTNIVSPKDNCFHSVTNKLKITNPDSTTFYCICLKKVIENILNYNDNRK